MLVRHYRWEAKPESVAGNPYLDDYYNNIPRWSFNLEIFFLKERFRDLLNIQRAKNTIIQDRSIFEGVYIFTANNHDMGNMSDRDFTTYMELFDSMMSVAKLPDLMIYLRARVSHLADNIHKRGRDCEQNIQINYLSNLNDRYNHFIEHTYPGRVLTIDVDQLDFEHSRSDFASVIRRIDQQLEEINNTDNRLF